MITSQNPVVGGPFPPRSPKYRGFNLRYAFVIDVPFETYVRAYPPMLRQKGASAHASEKDACATPLPAIPNNRFCLLQYRFPDSICLVGRARCVRHKFARVPRQLFYHSVNIYPECNFGGPSAPLSSHICPRSRQLLVSITFSPPRMHLSVGRFHRVRHTFAHVS